MYVLGISHDLVISSACLIKNGKIIFASSEERINRIKHFKGFPLNSVKACLEFANIKFEDLSDVAIGWNPSLTMSYANQNFSNNARNRWEYLYAIPNQIYHLSKKENFLKDISQEFFTKGPKITYHDHQLCHASLAFFQSGFEKSAILTVDGRGERSTGLLGYGKKNEIIKIRDLEYPNSLGLLYASITQFLGFRAESDEWKVMALGAYSNPPKLNSYIKKFNELYHFDSTTNNFFLNMDYFSFTNPETNDGKFYTNKLIKLIGNERRSSEKIQMKHFDIAYALQFHFELIMIKLLNFLYKKFPTQNLVLAGGCIMNCKFNGKIIEKTKFKNIYIPSAPDDSGISIGAALLSSYKNKKYNKRKKIITNYWGREFSDVEILKILNSYKLKFFKPSNLFDEVANLLSNKFLIGWFQGRSEFGQRALGNRSILADPRASDIKDIVNKSIKYRENFRPFAPAIIDSLVDEYFITNSEKNYFFMEKTKKFKRNVIKKVKGVVHDDNTGRIQTVSKKSNSNFYNLLKSFHKKTGIPILLNTSFNLNGEPIVDSPEDAIRTFYSCGLDYLVLGSYIISK